jgi:hypothetical protein
MVLINTSRIVCYCLGHKCVRLMCVMCYSNETECLIKTDTYICTVCMYVCMYVCMHVSPSIDLKGAHQLIKQCHFFAFEFEKQLVHLAHTLAVVLVQQTS